MEGLDVSPSLPGGWVAVAVAVGALATGGVVLTLGWFALTIDEYSGRNTLVPRLVGALVLVVVAVAAWPVADALASDGALFAPIFIKLRPLAYLAAAIGAAVMIVRANAHRWP